MDFDFSDDQQQLRDAVRKWVDKGASSAAAPRWRAGGFDRTAGELAELGLTALTVPEQHDGMGRGAIDAMVVMEELGRGMVLEPLAHTLHRQRRALPRARRRAGRLAARIASGEAPGGAGPPGAQGPATASTFGCKSGLQRPLDKRADSYQSMVPAGDQADAFPVPAQLGRQALRYFLVSGANGRHHAGYAHPGRQPRRRGPAQNAAATLVTQDRRTPAGTRRGHRHRRHLRRRKPWADGPDQA